jgi:ElaB/YqjD/DUF883 family membrane-anchored ribosome-binding protein
MFLFTTPGVEESHACLHLANSSRSWSFSLCNQKDYTVPKADAETRNAIENTEFAFPKQRKEPLEDATHVRNAISRFNQVRDVSDDERDTAWKRIEAAAKKYDVEITEKSWREIGKK